EEFCGPIRAANLSAELITDGDQGVVGIVEETDFIRQLSADHSHFKKGVKEKMEKDQVKQRFKVLYDSVLTWFDGAMYTGKAFCRNRRGEEPKYYSAELLPDDITEETLDQQLKSVFILHLQNDHSACWETHCLIKRGEGLKPIPNLIGATPEILCTFGSFLERIYRIQEGRSRVTDATSCPNENGFSVKNHFLPKDADLWRSCEERVHVFVLHRNEGYFAVTKELRHMIGYPLEEGSGEWRDAEQFWNARVESQTYNRDHLEGEVERRRERVDRARENLGSADPEQQWAAYKEPENDRCQGWRPIHAEDYIHLKEQCIHHVAITQTSCICALPTGSGKTKILFVPAVFKPHTLFVLVALTMAVHTTLYQEAVKSGLTAAMHNITPKGTRNKILLDLFFGAIQILILSPEMLGTPVIRITLDKVKNCQHREIIVFVDECHEALENSDRKASYTNVGQAPSDFTVLMSATVSSSDASRLSELMGVNFDERRVFISSNAIPANIAFSVVTKPPRVTLGQHIADLSASVLETPGRKVIVFCTTIPSLETLYTQLQSIQPPLAIARNHSKLDETTRDRDFREFVTPHGPACLMLATSGFGMSVNAQSVDLVLHSGFPMNCTQLLQQAGRGGRQHQDAKHIVVYSGKSGQRVVEDVIFASPNVQNWADTRRNLAAFNLYALLPFCRRGSFLQFVYDLPRRVCKDDELKCDVCLASTAPLVNVTDALRMGAQIVEAVTEAGLSLSTNEFFDIWKARNGEGREENDPNSKAAQIELKKKIAALQTSLGDDSIFLGKGASNEGHRRLMLEMLIWMRYVGEDVIKARGVNSSGFKNQSDIRTLHRLDHDLAKDELNGIMIPLK
ncbi:hypothetical protein HDU98_000367, partial [Podochytrium sp. JEL0797]